MISIPASTQGFVAEASRGLNQPVPGHRDHVVGDAARCLHGADDHTEGSLLNMLVF
jgi:hypothetical protein